MKFEVEVLDSTLREGLQAPGVRPRLELVEEFLLLLDELGVRYAEVGWPTASPRDLAVFRVASRASLSCTRITVFTSTRRPGLRAERDPLVSRVVELGVDYATVFGKAWLLHVEKVLRVDPEENISMIVETIEYLREHGVKVIFDAEHFFDGFLDNEEYAIQVLRAARDAGAEVLVLADTRGGMIPSRVSSIVSRVVRELGGVRVGVHMHDDSGCAVANTLVAVESGARHVQVTVNGVGERVGNADLVAVVANLTLKMGVRAVNVEKLHLLRRLSRVGYKLLGLQPNPRQPYVGDYAFAHKAGVHVDAVLKEPRSYEHVDPGMVGNRRRILASPLAGSAVASVAARLLGVNVSKSRLRDVVAKFKKLGVEDATVTLAAIIAERLGFGRVRPSYAGGLERIISDVERLYSVNISEAIRGIRVERVGDAWEARVTLDIDGVEYDAVRRGSLNEALLEAIVDAAIVLKARRVARTPQVVEDGGENNHTLLPPQGPEERGGHSVYSGASWR